jgi:hypothetical protein
VIVLILMMLIIIPLLTVNDPDISLSLGVQFVHDLGIKNAIDSATYNVRERCSHVPTALLLLSPPPTSFSPYLTHFF